MSSSVTDQLQYVRERIQATPTDRLTRLAADSGVCSRVLYNFRKPGYDPQYSTVFKLYSTLRKPSWRTIKK